MVAVAQLVRASDCGSEGRRFEPGQPPKQKKAQRKLGFFCFTSSDLNDTILFAEFCIYSSKTLISKKL